MSIMTPQTLKFMDFIKPQKSNTFESETTFLQIKYFSSFQMKDYFIAKSNFVGEMNLYIGVRFLTTSRDNHVTHLKRELPLNHHSPVFHFI